MREEDPWKDLFLNKTAVAHIVLGPASCLRGWISRSQRTRSIPSFYPLVNWKSHFLSQDSFPYLYNGEEWDHLLSSPPQEFLVL